MNYSRRQLIVWASELGDIQIRKISELTGQAYLRIFSRTFPGQPPSKIHFGTSLYDNEKNYRQLEKLIQKVKESRESLDFLPFFYGKTTDRHHVELLMLLRSLYDKECGISTERLKGKAHGTIVNRKNYQLKKEELLQRSDSLQRLMRKAAKLEMRDHLAAVLVGVMSALEDQDREDLPQQILKVIENPEPVDKPYEKIRQMITQ